MISHPPARVFEGVRGREIERSQQRGQKSVAHSYTNLADHMQAPGCRSLRGNIFICGAGDFSVCHHEGACTSPRLRCFISVGKLHCAVQAFVRCWFAYPFFGNVRASLHAGDWSIFSLTETATRKADTCVMTGANKQTQCFGPTPSLVLAQFDIREERGFCNISSWSRTICVDVMCTNTMCSSPVHDSCAIHMGSCVRLH